MGFQSSVPWNPNGLFWLAQKWLTLFEFLVISKMSRCYSMTWHRKTRSRRSFATPRATKTSCMGVNPFLALAALKKLLDQELNKHEDDEKCNYCQWETTDQAILRTATTTYEYKETLIDVIDDLIRHSYITKLKITSSWYRMKSQATTGVKNTAAYIT